MTLIFTDDKPAHGHAYGQVGGKWHAASGYDEQAARDAMRRPARYKKTEEDVKPISTSSGVRNESGQAIGVTVDGKFYESIHAAAKANDIAISSLCKALYKGRAQCKGHVIAYATKEQIVATARRL